jgi:hypothetical protein
MKLSVQQFPKNEANHRPEKIGGKSINVELPELMYRIIYENWNLKSKSY